MRLNSARQAWHDALYSQWNSNAAHFAMIEELGVAVQKTEIDNSVALCAHRAIAGRVQLAISTLPRRLQLFGHHMYAPGESDDLREEAEQMVFELAYSRGERMYAKKFERARHVAAGVLYRYRRMHQGGQSEAPDPLLSAESFRIWLFGVHEVTLDSRNWAREWEPFIDACFLACDDLDKKALVPVSNVISLMLEAA